MSTERRDSSYLSQVPFGEILAKVPNGLFIGGQWRGASDASRFMVENPATGSVIADVADAGPQDALIALDAAVEAADSWAATPPRVRSELLRNAFDLLQERKDDIALLITLEMGKPLLEAGGEVAYGGEFLRWFAEEAVRISGRQGISPEGTGLMTVSHRPVGPCYLITPWNFPLAMATRKIAPALAAGCTIVIKPADLTPLTTLYLAKIFDDVGLPAGVLNVIPTTKPADVSAPLLADRRLRKISFTGSTAVGKALMKQSADQVLRTSMELGGNAPFLVFEDADLEKAVDGAILAKFRNAGQACTAANRFLVHSSVVDEFTRRLARRVSALTVGAGTQALTDIGPLINRTAVRKVEALVADAVGRGAEVVAGGSRLDGVGHFFEPTIIRGAPVESRIAGEEIFGPVLSITEFDGEKEAVRMANGTEYGLVSYVFTESLARAGRIADRLETGMVGLNTGLVSNAAAPFGGVKQSGIGREGGAEGIHEYLNVKYALTPM